jgi:hypothetical protein
VAKPAAREMVVLNFDHELRGERFPLRRPFGTPATWPPGRLPGEARLFNELFQFWSKLFFLLRFESGTEANVVEQAIVVVQSKKERADDPAL